MSEEKKPLTVVRLTVDSYRRLRAAALTPTPTGLVLVRGKNEQGKSSLLGSMLEALGAEKSQEPITAGEHNGEVLMHLGDELVVKKRWTRDSGGKAKPALTIEAPDGRPVKTPATVLKDLKGQLADPVAFLSMSAEEQVKVVLASTGLQEALSAAESEAGAAYDRRRDLGRDADRAKKAASEMRLKYKDAPPVPEGPSDEELRAQLQAAEAINQGRAKVEREIAQHEARGQEIAAAVQRAKEELAGLEMDLERERAAYRSAVSQLSTSHPPAVDTAPIHEALRLHGLALEGRAIAEMVSRANEQESVAVSAHMDAEEALKAARAKVSMILANANFPVDEMQYDPAEKQLRLKGVPFQQASQAEKLKASAMIAMAGSKAVDVNMPDGTKKSLQLKLLFAREGSLLDEDSQAQLAELAEQNGFQLWLEVVDSQRDGAGIWIEDGQAFEEERS